MVGRLINICGLPGSGKTTLAQRLSADLRAVRFSSDDWMDALGINLWDADARNRIEKLQWEQAQDLIQKGLTVVIEWGTWTRGERERMRRRARELGASVELHFLDVDTDELHRRIAERDREEPPITTAHVASWSRVFERPTDDELAAYDVARRLPRSRGVRE